MLDSLMFTLFAAIVIIVIILELTAVSQMRARRSKQEPERIEPGTAERETSEEDECQHYLGYLATHPKNRPVPNECFGCEKAAECINSNLTESSNKKFLDVIRAEPP